MFDRSRGGMHYVIALGCVSWGAYQPRVAKIRNVLLAVIDSDSLRVLQNLGTDWDERVLPSIGNEIVKAVVAQYNAEQLLTQRDKVSKAVSSGDRALGTCVSCVWQIRTVVRHTE